MPRPVRAAVGGEPRRRAPCSFDQAGRSRCAPSRRRIRHAPAASSASTSPPAASPVSRSSHSPLSLHRPAAHGRAARANAAGSSQRSGWCDGPRGESCSPGTMPARLAPQRPGHAIHAGVRAETGSIAGRRPSAARKPPRAGPRGRRPGTARAPSRPRAGRSGGARDPEGCRDRRASTGACATLPAGTRSCPSRRSSGAVGSAPNASVAAARQAAAGTVGVSTLCATSGPAPISGPETPS